MSRTLPRSLAPILAAAFCITLVCAPALAVDCGDVDAQGACQDAETLVWCVDGELMTLPCPAGEVCSAHEAFDGGYGCVPPEDTPCGAVPAEGECTSAGNVVWCLESGKLELKQCGEEAVCGWDTANEWFDCLPAASMMAGGSAPESDDSAEEPPEPDPFEEDAGAGFDAEDPQDDAGPSEEDSGGEALHDTGHGPTPGVTPGNREDSPSGDSASDDSSAGCAGRGDVAPVCSWIPFILVLWRRRSLVMN